MIHIYTGKGKGKTTSAFGLALRAAGQGLKVVIFQFLKPELPLCGEYVSAKKIKNIKLVKFAQTHPIFTPQKSSSEKLKKTIEKDFAVVAKTVMSGKCRMVILDEIINAFDQKLLDKNLFLNFLKSVPSKVELILTGRGNISEIERYADYITVMTDKKHPFADKKTPARKGIEY
jgi:cob(I)alamin adenosyltransferase